MQCAMVTNARLPQIKRQQLTLNPLGLEQLAFRTIALLLNDDSKVPRQTWNSLLDGVCVN